MLGGEGRHPGKQNISLYGRLLFVMSFLGFRCCGEKTFDRLIVSAWAGRDKRVRGPARGCRPGEFIFCAGRFFLIKTACVGIRLMGVLIRVLPMS